MATAVVVAVCAVFVSLGQWQLRRHDERSLENAVNANRIASPPTELDVLLAGAGDDVVSLEYRPVRATGVFEAEGEIFVRSQVADERPGFHVVTPLRTNAGVVLVNRGWVPLAAEQPPVEEVPPPGGTVTVNGLTRLSQVRPSIGPEEPEGVLSIVSRIDLERLDQQFDDLLPVWIQQSDDVVDPLPVRVPAPATDDPGPHLPYAFQWYSFAVITAVGYGLLVRRALGGPK
jgi:cytochrome oxidase assembly protein ShyY1